MDKILIGLIAALVFSGGTNAQRRRQSRCEQGSCYPATGDLLIGRELQLSSTSTCGYERPERYCIVSHLEEDTKCFVCDSRHSSSTHRQSHRIENIVSSFRDRKVRWWQAENGVEEVSVQVDLEAEFHFTHLIMTFKTFRPKALLVERSYDFGKTWKVYRYFAYNCAKSFPGIHTGPVRHLNDVICTSRYSDVAPSTDGEVIFRVLPPFIPINDPYSEEVQDLLKLTNLRVNFTELHTLGDTSLDSRPEIKEKYYYAMYDMTVRGSCSCYGHASRCIPVDGYDNRQNMVHGQCECTHNTRGLNCEMCDDFYHDKPWRPARQNEPHACQKCECNNHATRCKFDPSVYEHTGQVSGGVCLDCLHNTMGRNCQECQQFYFQDPNRDIRDPQICQPCPCDPAGSEERGECESRTDEAFGLEAGRCHCKRFVEGRRCDTCQNGYWNLQTDNTDGCEVCTCNTVGTIGNYGCDKQTGLCHCKRYVTGRTCDQCFPGFWGLSGDLNGCRPCDCDVGGAVSEECDSRNGQCTCRENIIGRQCDRPRPGYFYTLLDYNVYEAEDAKGIGNTRVYIREPYAGGIQSWTGTGFMNIREGDSIEFTVDNIEFPMYYDLVIRYDPRMPEKWDDVRVTVTRPGEVDQNGPCANSIPQDDYKVTSLQPGSRHVVVSPASCLESGVSYTIRLDFNRYRSDVETPEADTLIDSIVLVPSTDSIPIFQGPGLPEYMKNEFMRFRCRDTQLHTHQPELPEICKKYMFSISSVIHQRALACECDPTGSLSSECDIVGGQCECKQNVVGRRCDQCAPGSYGFGPNGCIECNCHAIGARDNFCNSQTGQCLCIPNVEGRICDSCMMGFWGFPQCRPCDCNGNADRCDDLTGRCYCSSNTTGDNCERCVDGFYGDPRIHYRIPCQECMCPQGPYSQVWHADSCSLDHHSQSMVCRCQVGYTGPNCDTCSDNFFGSPELAGESCESCMCNNNIDPNVPGSCDTTTGECLKCLFNTEGFSCERCIAGYHGDATIQNCQRCVCLELGTDLEHGECHRETGQCPCKPNVVDVRCDSCDFGYWNLTSNEGCAGCYCDPDGSLAVECNQFDGQCECKPGRGGRTCGDCEDFYWGDPTDQCYPCECHGQGAREMQCDRRTGQCRCLTGISGYKCDRCDRGTTGELPNCVPCGECFDNWDRIARDLRDQTRELIEEARKIQVSGAAGAFDKEFRNMEDMIEEIRKIIESAQISSVDVRDIEELLQSVRQNLTDNAKGLNVIDDELRDTIGRIQQGNNRISALQQRVQKLKKLAEELRNNATDIQARDVEGAFNITKEAQLRSRQAQSKVDGTESILQESERTRQEVENLIAQNEDDFNRQIQENEDALSKVDGDISSLGSRIADLNDMVCDGHGEPCDNLCGGGGCGQCGGLSCADGAVTKADNALELAKQAETILNMKEEGARNKLTEIQEAQQDAEESKAAAQMAYNKALEAKNQSQNAKASLEDLLNRISDFLGQRGAKPSDIRQVAEEVLSMSISLTPAQILELAKRINETIQGLQNIDSILDDTRDDLALAEKLKERADSASRDAAAILGTAEDVLKALEGAKAAQDKAERAINQADQDIQDAEGDLTQIESETAAAGVKSNESLNMVQMMKEQLSTLKKKYTQNDLNVEMAEKEAAEAARLATMAERDAADLQSKYEDTSDKLDSKHNMTSQAQDRAKKLKDRADMLAHNTTIKLQKLKDMQSSFEMNEKDLKILSTQIDELNKRMEEYLEAIKDKAQEYRKCSPT